MRKKDININTFFNTMKTIFGIIFPLITFPYISRVLGAENVGKISFSNSIVSYVSLFASLGITTYAVRECSKVREDKETLNKLAGQIFSINLISTAIAYIVMLVMIECMDILVDYKTIILIQSITVLFTTLGADWINTVFEDFKFIAIRTILVQLVSLLAMFMFVQKETDYVIYAIISMMALSGANIINIFYREKKCKVRITKCLELKKHMPSILLMFSMTLSQTIYVNSDITLLGLIRGDFEVGLYSTSVKLYNLVNSVIASVAWVVMPQISAYYLKKDYNNIKKILRYSLNYIVVLGIPCFAGINAIAPQLIETIAGQDFLEATTSLRILSVSLMFSLIGGFIGNIIMLPSGREKVCLKSCIISSIINLIANCICIPIWGLNGAAFTTALSELIGMLFVSSKVEKEIKIENIKGIIKAPAVGGIMIIIFSILVKQIVQNVYAVTLITISGSVLIYLMTLFVLKNEFFMDICKSFLNKRGND